MKKLFITFLSILTVVTITNSETPLGFKYQAVVRNVSGEIVALQSVGICITLLKAGAQGEVVYSETFTLETNEFGLVNLVIGSGTPQEGSFNDIDWSSADYFINVGVDVAGGSDYIDMGTSQLLSVPYAQYAFSGVTGEQGPEGPPGTTSWIDSDEAVSTKKNVGIGTTEPTAKLEVIPSDDHGDEEPIFEVKNKNGETVFAVYNNRVEVIIDDNYPEKTKGGFAVSGRTTTKQEPQDILIVQPGLTQVFVDEQQHRRTKGGFAVSGRTTTKNELYDLLHIQPDRTKFFIKTLSGNQDPENFSISLLDQNLTSLSLFEVSGTSTFIHTPLVMDGYFDIIFYVYMKDPVGIPFPLPEIPVELIGGGEAYSGITNNNGIVVFYNIPAGLDYFYVTGNYEGNIFNLDRDIIIPVYFEP